MKKILLWDPRHPAANPVRLEIDDAIASACVRAGVAAAADPADAGALAAGSALSPDSPTQIIIWSGITKSLRRVAVPLAVASLATAAGVAVLPGGGVLPGGAIRIHPVSAEETYVIAPHASLGAIAWRLVAGNGPSFSGTPSNSVGAPYGGLRLWGQRQLAGVSDDPGTAYKNILADDIGSQQMALYTRSTGLAAGVFHGFGAGGSNIVTSPDITTDRYVSAFSLSSAPTLAWADGKTLIGSDLVTFNPDGSLTSRTTFLATDYEIQTAYVDMVISDYGFNQAKRPADANWTKLNNSLNGALSDTLFDDADTLILRDSTTGITCTITDNVRANPSYTSKFIRSDSTRYKTYAKMMSPVGSGSWPGCDITRTLTYGQGSIDYTTSWIAAVDGAKGVRNWGLSNETSPTLGAEGVTYTRIGSGTAPALGYTHKLAWRRPCLPNTSYRVLIGTALGPNAISTSNGMSYAVTANKGNPIAGALVNLNYQNLVAAGKYLTFTTPADCYEVQVMIQQVSGTAGQVMYVSDVGVLEQV